MSTNEGKLRIKLGDVRFKRDFGAVGTPLSTYGATKEQIDEVLEKAKEDFPFKIYKDNDGFGTNPKHTFSFYKKNPKNPNESFPLEDLLDVEREIAIWFKKWFGE
jgi:hypothetical protein